MTTQEKIIPDFIKNAIKAEVEKATSQELEEAQKRIEKRKIEIVSHVMLSINKYMSMEKLQDTYKFTIEIK
jgi:replication fork clamp-binding protein CrfC